MMAHRAQLKQASLERILDAAADRLRREGLDGAAIAPVMQDAGLTHGAFYSHFSNKNELATAAFRHALVSNRPRWMGKTQDPSWVQRLVRLGKRYLTPAHRDNLSDSCALAALASDAARSDPAFRSAYEGELRKSLAAICAGSETDPKRLDDAIAFMALCIGGLSLSRAVSNKTFSNQILRVCQAATARLTDDNAKVTTEQQKAP